MSGLPFELNPRQTGKHTYIGFLDGQLVGETVAVSPEKAANNLWWVHGKKRFAGTLCAWEPKDLKIYESISYRRKNNAET